MGLYLFVFALAAVIVYFYTSRKKRRLAESPASLGREPPEEQPRISD